MIVAKETLIFLYSCVLGAGLGSVYDIFRIIRATLPSGHIAVFVEDSIFMIIASIATFIFSISFCNGYFRVFVIVGEVLGFVIYYCTVGVLVFNFFKGLISVLKSILVKIYRLVLKPILNFFKYIYIKFSSIFKQFSQKFSLGFFGRNFHLKQHNNLLYYNNRDIVCVEESDANYETKNRRT